MDIIKQVGIEGTFLNTKQTRTLWRSEAYMPQVYDEISYQEEASGGRKTVINKAKERMQEILVSHKPNSLTDEQNKEIDIILKKATEYYEKKGLI